MQAQMMLPVVLFAAFAAYAIYSMSKRKHAMANLGPAYERFFAQTGYAHAELAGAPLAVQAELSAQKWRDMAAGKPLVFELVRDVHGIPLLHRSFVGGEYRGTQHVTTMSCSWSVMLGRAPRVPLQVAERSLTGMGKALKEMMTSTTRSWQPLYPTKVELGDAELDRRFVVYGIDPDAVRWALAQPGVRELLLGCAEVDLTVRTDGEIRFADPFQHNLRAGMGGTAGALALAGDPARMLEVTVPVHERIAQLVATVARAS